MFMHTLNGRPATYAEGEQVVYAQQGRYSRKGLRLAASLDQIKREWRASELWRARRGFDQSVSPHSYVRIEVPR